MTEEQKETELSFNEKVMLESWTSAEKIGKMKKLKAADVREIALTFFNSSMENIRESKKTKAPFTNSSGSVATEGQIAFLRELGYDGNLNISKIEASKLIEDLKSKRGSINNY